MKKLRSVLSLVALSAAIVFTSCDKDDDKPEGEFASGVFVVNEGNFTEADGTISFFDPSSKTVKEDLFGSINDGRALGSVVQSVKVDGDLAYIVVNNSNKVEVVNANTFVSEYTLEDVKLPRYFTTFNGKGYLTEWVSFSDPGRVAVINLNNHSIETTITTDFGAENIIAANGKLFVSNNFTNTVSIIDPVSNEVIDAVEVGNGPGEFAIDKENKLWVICGGGYDMDYNPLNDGALYRINTTTNEVDKTILLNTNVSSKMVMNKSRDVFYYYKGKNIYDIFIADETASGEALIAGTDVVGFYGIGFDAKNEIIYAADAKGFSGNGIVYRYQTDGTLIDTFDAGRGPNGFVFK
jgi:YVTN family beta-propeller protein